MKKGIFGSWFREIATIIFTQTIQAFLLAIVMSIIISALGKTTGDSEGSTAAAGLLAIIALSQFGKFELLIKNIFGVTSGIADVSMQGGARGLTAGKVFAMGAARRLADNGRKIATGIKSFKTGSEIKNLNQAKEDLEKRVGGTTAPELLETDPEKIKESIQNGEFNSGVGGGLGISSADIVAAINEQTNEIRQQTAAQQRNNLDNKLEQLTQKIAEKKEERSKQRREGVAGITETAGAIYGASAGLSVGLARGDAVAETTIAGAGAGDIAGQTIANVAFSTPKSVKGISKTISNPKTRQEFSATSKALDDINKQIEEVTKNKQKITEELIQKQKSAQKDYDNMYKKLTNITPKSGNSNLSLSKKKINDKNADIGKM